MPLSHVTPPQKKNTLKCNKHVIELKHGVAAVPCVAQGVVAFLFRTTPHHLLYLFICPVLLFAHTLPTLPGGLHEDAMVISSGFTSIFDNRILPVLLQYFSHEQLFFRIPPPPLLRCALPFMSQAGQPPVPPVPPVPVDDKGWVLGGLEKDVDSDVYKRRHKHKGGDKFSLSAGLTGRLPAADRGGLDVVGNFINGKDNSFPFMFFNETFPEACQKIVLDEVSR